MRAINATAIATTSSGLNFGALLSTSKKRIIPNVLLGVYALLPFLSFTIFSPNIYFPVLPTILF